MGIAVSISLVNEIGRNFDGGLALTASTAGRPIGVERHKRARLMIADDHILLAEACKNLLEPEFEVVSIVGDGRALLQAAAELKPDVVIVDIAMPQLNGLDAGH